MYYFSIYRQYAKQIFHPLIQQGQFDAVLKKYVPANDIRNLQKLLDNLSNEVSLNTIMLLVQSWSEVEQPFVLLYCV